MSVSGICAKLRALIKYITTKTSTSMIQRIKHLIEKHIVGEEPNYNERRNSLSRFVQAQDRDYKTALAEIRNGRKMTHWIWYIFPQIEGLEHSCYSNLYGIRDISEARAYLSHPVLGKRLREITGELLKHGDLSAQEILGELDAKKVRSCMTLFDRVSPDDVFAQVLNTFYGGTRCELTLEKMNVQYSHEHPQSNM